MKERREVIINQTMINVTRPTYTLFCFRGTEVVQQEAYDVKIAGLSDEESDSINEYFIDQCKGDHIVITRDEDDGNGGSLARNLRSFIRFLEKKSILYVLSDPDSKTKEATNKEAKAKLDEFSYYIEQGKVQYTEVNGRKEMHVCIGNVSKVLSVGENEIIALESSNKKEYKKTGWYSRKSFDDVCIKLSTKIDKYINNHDFLVEKLFFFLDLLIERSNKLSYDENGDISYRDSDGNNVMLDYHNVSSGDPICLRINNARNEQIFSYSCLPSALSDENQKQWEELVKEVPDAHKRHIYQCRKRARLSEIIDKFIDGFENKALKLDIEGEKNRVLYLQESEMVRVNIEKHGDDKLFIYSTIKYADGDFVKRKNHRFEYIVNLNDLEMGAKLQYLNNAIESHYTRPLPPTPKGSLDYCNYSFDYSSNSSDDTSDTYSSYSALAESQKSTNRKGYQPQKMVSFVDPDYSSYSSYEEFVKLPKKRSDGFNANIYIG